MGSPVESWSRDCFESQRKEDELVGGGMLRHMLTELEGLKECRSVPHVIAVDLLIGNEFEIYRDTRVLEIFGDI